MRYTLLVIGLVIVQALVFCRIHLFGAATPLPFVYAVLVFRRDVHRWLRLIIAFAAGLALDAFGNTPGLNAAALTFAAFLQPYVLEMLIDKDEEEDFSPTMHKMGFLKYLAYAVIITAAFVVVLFGLDAFSLAHWRECLIGAGASLTLTLFFILIFEATRR